MPSQIQVFFILGKNKTKQNKNTQAMYKQNTKLIYYLLYSKGSSFKDCVHFTIQQFNIHNTVILFSFCSDCLKHLNSFGKTVTLHQETAIFFFLDILPSKWKLQKQNFKHVFSKFQKQNYLL